MKQEPGGNTMKIKKIEYKEIFEGDLAQFADQLIGQRGKYFCILDNQFEGCEAYVFHNPNDAPENNVDDFIYYIK